MRPSALAFLLLCGAPAALAAEPPPRLTKEPVLRVIGGGETHAFDLPLSAGQLAGVQVMQRGADVVVRVFDPLGARLAEVDGPSGGVGPESVEIDAKVDGTYRVTVAALEPGALPARYDVSVPWVLSAAEHRRFSTRPLEVAEARALAGSYEIAPGHYLDIGLLDEVGMRLVEVDSRTGEGRAGCEGVGGEILAETEEQVHRRRETGIPGRARESPRHSSW